MNQPKKSTPITCQCGFKLWNGEVVRSRILRIRPDGYFEAKCRCKRWLSLPIRLKKTTANA